MHIVIVVLHQIFENEYIFVISLFPYLNFPQIHKFILIVYNCLRMQSSSDFSESKAYLSNAQ